MCVWGYLYNIKSSDYGSYCENWKNLFFCKCKLPTVSKMKKKLSDFEWQSAMQTSEAYFKRTTAVAFKWFSCFCNITACHFPFSHNPVKSFASVKTAMHLFAIVILDTVLYSWCGCSLADTGLVHATSLSHIVTWSNWPIHHFWVYTSTYCYNILLHNRHVSWIRYRLEKQCFQCQSKHTRAT